MKTSRSLKSALLALAITSSALLSLGANAANIPDPNGDGQINISDVVRVQMYLVGDHEPTNLDVYDIDRNGIISRMDVKCLEMYLSQTWEGNGVN